MGQAAGAEKRFCIGEKVVNIIAIDIGNTNVNIGLFIDDMEKSVESVPGADTAKLTAVLKEGWAKIPIAKSSKEKKRDGVIVACSVKEAWTKQIKKIAKDQLGEKVLEVGLGKDVPLPMSIGVDNPGKVGVDRIVNAAAAFAVVQDAVTVADFGTAVTIDLVDEDGVFLGGVILPGFAASAEALHSRTAKLPEVKIKKPKSPIGANTKEAINSGLYYSAVGTLETILRHYAEELGKWPQTVVTGAAANVIKDDCDFVDSFVTDLAVKGIVLAYKKFVEEKAEAL